MKHFVAEEWVDFVNNQLSPQQMEPMQRHLETGCQRCSQLFETWNLVSQAAKRESNFKVPESAVRHVLNAFEIMAEPKSADRVFEIPRLVFDSLWQPAMAGVRSGPSTPRHLLYKAGEISIELVLEAEPPSDRVNITGQVSSNASQDEVFTPVPVVLRTSSRKVVEATTNRHGEFHLGFVPESGLRLSFASLGGKELSIPLDGAGMRTFLRP